MKTIATTIFALSFSLGSLAISAATPAHSATYITANLPTDSGASNLMELCAVECIQNINSDTPIMGKTPDGRQLYWPEYRPSSSGSSDTSGLMNFLSPQPGDYKVAVRYSNSSMTNAIGYLKEVAGGYAITKSWTESTTISVPDSSGSIGTFTILEQTSTTSPQPAEIPAIPFASVAGSMSFTLNTLPVISDAKIGFCIASCLDSNQAILDDATGQGTYPAHTSINSQTGLFELSNVPHGTYAIAVNAPGVGNGYLRSKNGSFDITPNIDDAASFGINGNFSHTFSVEHGSLKGYPKASYGITASTISIPGGPKEFNAFNFTITDSSPSTRVNVKVIGCNGSVVAETNRSGKGTYKFSMNPSANRLGKNWKLIVTISEPGYVPDVSTLSKFTPDWDFNCTKAIDQALPPTGHASPLVKKWSVKAGKHKTAKINRKNYITKPHVIAGSKVTYTWKLNGKVVDRDRVVTAKTSWLGKTLRVTVKVKKAGEVTQSRTISYGKVKK